MCIFGRDQIDALGVKADFGTGEFIFNPKESGNSKPDKAAQHDAYLAKTMDKVEIPAHFYVGVKVGTRFRHVASDM